jgi:hypothetical protein
VITPKLKDFNRSTEFMKTAATRIMEDMDSPVRKSMVAQAEAWGSHALGLSKGTNLIQQVLDDFKAKDVYTSH